MPKIDFSQENKAAIGENFPKLKLAKDEQARLVCIEQPDYEFVHNLKAPKLINGKPVMEKVTTKDGGSYEKMEMDFIGRPICHGTLEVLKDKGVDPKNCAACDVSTKGDEITPPERRFAMHVVKYATKPGSAEIQEPFSVQIVIWSFTDFVYNKLADLAKEWDNNLMKHDLIIKCTNATFQNYELSMVPRSAWTENQERINLVKTTFAANQAKDLSAYCGRKSTAEWFKQDVEKVRARWRQLQSAGTDVVTVAEVEDLSAGLDDLLNGSGAAETAPSTPDSTDPLMEFTPQKVEQQQADIPPVEALGDATDFDKLFEDLK